jgi:hypothetical protein
LIRHSITPEENSPLYHLILLRYKSGRLTKPTNLETGNVTEPPNTVKPRFTNASDHEQFGLRTNFPNTKRLG